MPEPVAIPLAHVGHFLWILYVLPVLIVIGSIVRTTLAERRRRTEDEEGRQEAEPADCAPQR